MDSPCCHHTQGHQAPPCVIQTLVSLPFSAVHELLSQTLHLLHDQHLLEAHAGLMVLERLRDNTLSQLHHSDLLNAQDLDIVETYFSGLQKVNEELTRQLWNIIGRSMKLVHEDPALFVSAVRIIEREENIDALFLDTRSHHFLPPGRPKSWRQKFYQVLQETITVAHFQASHADMKGPGMARHLAALQSNILAELCVVKDLMVQCCPVHYNILNVCTIMYHQGLSSHLQDILSWDLDKQEIFIVLDWVLHVYHRSMPARGQPVYKYACVCVYVHVHACVYVWSWKAMTFCVFVRACMCVCM